MMTISRGLGQSFNFGEGHIERSKRVQKNWGFFGLRQQEQDTVGFLITYLNTVIDFRENLHRIPLFWFLPYVCLILMSKPKIGLNTTA